MKYSKQNETILNYLKSTDIHPTADRIYNDIKKEISNISLGTVYRNLDKLEKSGDIIRLKFKNKKDRFDGNILPHYHATCLECGDIYDICYDYFFDIDKIIEENINCKVISHDIIFNIICPNCKKNREEL